jgi:hypothetical protein
VEWLDWSNPWHMRGESLEAYPGIAILERGYINVAIDPGGGGNPYFIPTDEGEDPPLFRCTMMSAMRQTRLCSTGVNWWQVR